MTAERLTIRAATPADAAAITGLSAQLGYPVAVEALADRLVRLIARTDQAIFVACAESGEVVGWIHGAEHELVEAERRCEILGLVVDRTRRRQGIGHLLIAAIERWAAGRGLRWMSVRSNAVRVESHPFYEQLGYRRVKTQHAYRKPLTEADA